MNDRWSHPISVNFEIFDNFGDEGALVSIRFVCTKCGKPIEADVEAPGWTTGAPVWGDGTEVECDCGAEYSLAI